MDPLNAVLTQGAEWLLAPFRSLPTTGLVFWSIVVGLLMTYIFGKTSNQAALRRAADNIRAQLFAVKLFKEDLWVTFQCQVRLLKSTGMRLLHSIPPMLVMVVPLLMILIQLGMRYEFRPFVRGEETVVTIRVRPDSWKSVRDTVFESGPNFRIETPAVRDDHHHTLHWRVRATGSESALMRWRVGEESVVKRLPVAESPEVLIVANPHRPSESWWDRMLFPAEPSLPADSAVESIDIQLASRVTPVFGWPVPWWLTFFVVSMLVAFLAGKVIGVQY